MKRVVYLLVLLVSISMMGLAQNDHPQPPGRKLQALKAAYITKQLNLTSEEAEKFWPVYYNYQGDLRKTRQDKTLDVLTQEENMLNVRRKYQGEFKKVLGSDERSNKVLTVDRDFNNMIRKELQQRMEKRKKEGPPSNS
jgi:hypothetical protein